MRNSGIEGLGDLGPEVLGHAILDFGSRILDLWFRCAQSIFKWFICRKSHS